MAERRQTALGVARSRFLEGLPHKAREVHASVALLADAPGEEHRREELRRRLHALYASAQVFRIERLAGALRDAIAELDAVRDARRPFEPAELDSIAELATSLPSFVASDEPADTPSVIPGSVPSISPSSASARNLPRPSREPTSPPQEEPLPTAADVLVVDEPLDDASNLSASGAVSGPAPSIAPDVMLGRSNLEARLREGGDVDGRVEDLGLYTLLTTVASLRPDAQVIVRDSSSLFELRLQDGDLVDATRTAADGSFGRGPRALEGSLGVTSGQFTVRDASRAVRRSLHEPLRQLLDGSLQTLAARVDALSGRNLPEAASVTLDVELVTSLVHGSPEEVQRVAARLAAGEGPRRLLRDPELDPQLLEDVLVVLARQGAVLEVHGPDGEDRVALARAGDSGARPAGLPPGGSDLPSPSAPPEAFVELLNTEPPPRAERIYSAPPEAFVELLNTEPPPRAERSSEPDDRERSSAIPVLDEPFDDVTPSAPDAAELATAAAEPAQDEVSADDAEARKAGPDDAEPAQDEVSADAPETQEAAADDAEPAQDEVSADAPETQEAAADDQEARETKPDDGLRNPPLSELAASVEASPSRRPRAPSRVEDLPNADPPLTPQSKAGPMGWIGWTLVLLTLTATGFMGARFFGLPGASETRSGPLPPLVPPAHAASPSAGEAGMGPRPADADEPATGSSAPTLVAHGREEERIAELGVEVPSGQGLLVLEPAPGEPAPRTSVELEGRRIALDTEPVALAVRPGVHHLRFTRGDHQDFVWVAVRPGHTRFVPPLP